MGKIIGDQNTISQARKAKDNVYINWDAVDSLPEQFEAVVTKVTFDPNKDWVEVGNGNYMPNPDVVYEIAKACGINGVPSSQIEPMYMDVNYNELERFPGFNSAKMCVGYKSVKQSWVLNEDGTQLFSSTCSAVYNAWDRALGMWAKEEKQTDGYNESTVRKMSNGNRYWEGEFYDQKTGQTKKYKIFPKYESKYDRKAHFYDLMKFAQKVAETQAFFKTIRELAGLKTGYKAEDLKDGYMVFYKIRKSERVLKLETAARLKYIEGGGSRTESQDMLFGNQEPAYIVDNSQSEKMQIAEPVETNEDDFQLEPDNPKDFQNDVGCEELAGNLESIIGTLSETKADGKQYSDKQKCAGMIKWLRSNPDMTDKENSGKFNRALEFFTANEVPFY